MKDCIIYINSNEAAQLLSFLIKSNNIKKDDYIIVIHSDITLEENLYTSYTCGSISKNNLLDLKQHKVLILTPIASFSHAIWDLRTLESLNLELVVLPKFEFWNSTKLKDQNYSKVSVGSLLKYPSFREHSKSFYKDKTVLITGAAGSIGLSLTKALANFCRKLICLDHSENGIFQLNQWVSQNSSKTQVICEIANIRDHKRLTEVFDSYDIDVVFHLAAYKHVDLMEYNPYEAFETNVIGSKHIFDISLSFKVKYFNFISSDKAVQPINTMGLTKKIAEDYILNHNSDDIHTTVFRFGNVLGSSGSVVDRFTY